ncbi:hypothetical protein V6N13_142202 [Hibiscus sabdariffa]|uniref:Uncharacterized protein n=1 Tax=Hibiscus sabdariffa TaxID=183260 RepID=A0ABR2FDE6_9ROSI
MGVDVPRIPVRCGKCAVFGHPKKHYKFVGTRADVPVHVIHDQGVIASDVANGVHLPVCVSDKGKKASSGVDNEVVLPASVLGHRMDDCNVGSSKEPLVAPAVGMTSIVHANVGIVVPELTSEVVDPVDLGPGPSEVRSPKKTRAASKR